MKNIKVKIISGKYKGLINYFLKKNKNGYVYIKDLFYIKKKFNFFLRNNIKYKYIPIHISNIIFL